MTHSHLFAALPLNADLLVHFKNINNKVGNQIVYSREENEGGSMNPPDYTSRTAPSSNSATRPSGTETNNVSASSGGEATSVAGRAAELATSNSTSSDSSWDRRQHRLLSTMDTVGIDKRKEGTTLDILNKVTTLLDRPISASAPILESSRRGNEEWGNGKKQRGRKEGAQLEPTPIGPHGKVQVVEELPVESLLQRGREQESDHVLDDDGMSLLDDFIELLSPPNSRNSTATVSDGCGDEIFDATTARSPTTGNVTLSRSRSAGAAANDRYGSTHAGLTISSGASCPSLPSGDHRKRRQGESLANNLDSTSRPAKQSRHALPPTMVATSRKSAPTTTAGSSMLNMELPVDTAIFPSRGQSILSSPSGGETRHTQDQERQILSPVHSSTSTRAPAGSSSCLFEALRAAGQRKTGRGTTTPVGGCHSNSSATARNMFGQPPFTFAGSGATPATPAAVNSTCNDNRYSSFGGGATTGNSVGESPAVSKNRFRAYQAEQWYERFQDMIVFQRTFGHCCVPNTFPSNPHLAQWVKRQRYQYKLKQERKHSTLTDERQALLERMGFVWDSHGAAWMERWSELRDFHRMNGHSNIPTNYPPNRQLSIWVKCQRRQYKLYTTGQRSNMTADRITRLEQLNFCWNPRGIREGGINCTTGKSDSKKL